MKRFICAILIFLMLPLTCLAISGCDDKEYKLNQFYTSYKNIGNGCKNLNTMPVNGLVASDTSYYKIDIDYTKSTKLFTLVENNGTQYYYLKYFYQQLLDNSLAPLYYMGESVASSKQVSNKQTKQLYTKLEVLQQEYHDIDYYLGILINSLNATENTTINLSNLKKVFVQYEQAITAANDLSYVIYDIYFNDIANNSSFNYTNKTYSQLTESDLTRVVVDTRTRVYFYKSIFANAYNQLYIRNNDWAQTLSTNTNVTLPSYAPYDYIKNVSILQSKATTTLVATKSEIYNNVVSFYNILNTFPDAYANFNLATSKVAYAELNQSSTADQINYGNIINQFSNGIAVDSYEIIHNLTDLLYN